MYHLLTLLTIVGGAIIACVLHFIVGALMASYGHEVDSIDGNTILTWQIESTSAAKGVIACCYIFVGVYGITWVSLPLRQLNISALCLC